MIPEIIETIERVIIVGSGPAGLTAAIYAARANLHPLLIEGIEAGGQLTITTDVDNYPGFAEGIQGPELMLQMKKQAERFATRFLSGEVSAVDLLRSPFTVTVDAEQSYRTETLILASGARAKGLGLPSEQRLMGHGVSACATCDGFFFRDKEVYVIGGGDTAMEEALFLANLAKKVTVVHRRDRLRASAIMQERAFRHPKIVFLWNHVLMDLMGADRLEAILLQDYLTGAVSQHPAEGVFIAIGHEPNTRFLKGQVSCNAQGYIQTVPGSTRTDINGVFACGDVQDPLYRQAVTAAGSGCMAAMDAQRFLESIHQS